MELIEIICKFEYANWKTLIQTCKWVYANLKPLRWAAKVATQSVDIAECKPMYYNGGLYRAIITTLSDNNYRIVAYFDRGEWYEISYIAKQKNINARFWDGEFVLFDGDKVSNIHWYYNYKCLFSYDARGGPGNRYYTFIYSTIERIYATKADVVAKLDDLGVKYKWLKYLKHEN
jgi:hypothetical protein